jgi:integrase
MAKRQYGMGSIYQRNDIWWVKLYVDGDKVERSSKSRKKADAQKLLEKLLGERHRGSLKIEKRSGYTIGQALDLYIKRSDDIAERTLQNYTTQAHVHLKPFMGDIAIKDLTAEKILEYREARAKTFVRQGDNANPTTKRKGKKFVSPTTINREVALLRASLKDLKRFSPGSVGELPYFEMPREDNARQGFLNDEGFEVLLYEQPLHLKALTACGYYCGGRAGEWLRGDWEDLDFRSGIFYFPKTKNNHPREVPIIDGHMRDLLLAQKERNHLLWPEQKAVFVWDGKRLAGIGDAWKKAAERAGFPSLGFHDLRRSANRNMRDRGIPQAIRMAIMGHLTPSQDERYGIVDHTDILIAKEKMKR